MKLDENLSKEAIKPVEIFGIENLIKSDVNNNNDITIPDKSNSIPIGYY